MKIVGRWQDKIRKIDGLWVPGQEGEFEWDFNQIQNTFAKLLASWCRGEVGLDRISFMAIGSGLVGWDSAPPAQPYSQEGLTTEYFRKAIPQADIVFIDPITNLPTADAQPSSKIEITVEILSGEADGSMREFGLFGGAATDLTPDTGTHDGSSSSAVLIDSGESWPVGGFVGGIVTNTTDGSSGTITANTDTEVTATLSGGTDNDWDSGDAYSIVIPGQIVNWIVHSKIDKDSSLEIQRKVRLEFVTQ